MAKRREARVEGYLSRLYGYALSLGNDRDTARDLVQEAVLKALAATRTPTDEPAYRAWLFRILRNAFLDYARRSGREVATPESEPEVDSNAIWRCDDKLISELTVRSAMARPKPHHREIIALVDIVGFTYMEAAAVLDVPNGTVMSRISRARLALMGEIADGILRPLPRAAGRNA